MPLSLIDLPTALLQHLCPFLTLADAISRMRCCSRMFAATNTMPIRTLMRQRLITLHHHCLLPQTLYPTCSVPPHLRNQIRSLLYDALGPNPSLFCDLRDVAGLTVAKPMALCSLFSGLEELQLQNVNATTHEIDFDTVFTPQLMGNDSSAVLPPVWQLRTLQLIGPHAHVTDNDTHKRRTPSEQRLLHSTILHRLLPLHSSSLRVLEIRLAGSANLSVPNRLAQQETDELLLSGLVRAIASAQLHGLERLRLEYQQECDFDEDKQRKLCGAQPVAAAEFDAADDGSDPLAFYNFSHYSVAKAKLMRRFWHSMPSLTFLQLAWFHPLLVLPFHAALPQLHTLHFAGLLTFDSLPSLARFSSLQHLLLDFFVQEEELRREWKGELRLDDEVGAIRSAEEDAAIAAAARLAVPATHAAPLPLEVPDANSSKDVDVSFYVFHALARLTQLRSIQLQSTLQERNCCRVDWDNFTLLQPLSKLIRLQFSCFVPPISHTGAQPAFLAPPLPPEPSGLSLAQLKLSPNLVDAVTPLVFLGSKQANTLALRASLGFTHVVQISGLPHAHLADLPEPPVHQDGRHHYVQLDDDEEATLADHLPAFFDFMAACDEKKGHRVLVHCDAGVSRSASFVIAWLMHTYGMSLQSALERVQQSRPAIDINRGFRSQLAALESTWRHDAAPAPSVDLSWELDRLCETLPQLQDVIVNIERREEYENEEEQDDNDDDENEDNEDAEDDETTEAPCKQAKIALNTAVGSHAPLPLRRVLAPYVVSLSRPRRLKKLGVWDGHASSSSDGSQCILTNLAPFLTSFPKLHSLSLIFCHVSTMLPISRLADSLVSLCLYFTQTPRFAAADPTVETTDSNISALSSLRNLSWLILHGTGDLSTCLSAGQLLQLGSVVNALPRLRNCRIEHQPAMSEDVWNGWLDRDLLFPHLCSLSFKDCSGLGVEGVLAVLHAVLLSLTNDAAPSSSAPALLPLLVDLNVVHACPGLDTSDAASASRFSARSLIRDAESQIRAAEARTLRHVELHLR